MATLENPPPLMKRLSLMVERALSTVSSETSSSAGYSSPDREVNASPGASIESEDSFMTLIENRAREERERVQKEKEEKEEEEREREDREKKELEELIKWTTAREQEMLHFTSLFTQGKYACRKRIRAIYKRIYWDRISIGVYSLITGIGLGLGDAVYSVWYWALLIFVMSMSILGYLVYMSLQTPEIQLYSAIQYQQKCSRAIDLIYFQLSLNVEDRTSWPALSGYIYNMWQDLLILAETISINGNPWGYTTPALLHQLSLKWNIEDMNDDINDDIINNDIESVV